ncbi:MAG: hypothetical protein V3V99_02020 [candidate division Zixibacteria bacterium]
MTTKFFLLTLAGVALGMAMFLIGCSSEDDAVIEVGTVTDEIIDQLIDTNYADNDAEQPGVEFANEVTEEGTVVFSEQDLQSQSRPVILDIIAIDENIYGLHENGIVIHHRSDGTNSFVTSEKPLGAMIRIGEKVLVGGDNLYTLEDGELVNDDFDLNLSGTITALAQKEQLLYVGTTEGFYQVSCDGVRELTTGIKVSNIAPEPRGVWIGTAGDGLYFWDGMEFRKRYLRRDSTLFDNVTALQYSHNHIYLGTDKGLFIYDGGRWQPYGLGDGLPSEIITAINADDWVVKIGTTNGAVTFFENQFKMIPKFEGLMVNRMIKYKNKLIAATSEGLLMKSGGLVSTLFDGQIPTQEIALGKIY